MSVKKTFLFSVGIFFFILSNAIYSDSLRCGKGYVTCLALERESKTELIACCGKPAKALRSEAYDPDSFEPKMEWYLYKCKSGRLKKVFIKNNRIIKIKDSGRTSSGFQHCE